MLLTLTYQYVLLTLTSYQYRKQATSCRVVGLKPPTGKTYGNWAVSTGKPLSMWLFAASHTASHTLRSFLLEGALTPYILQGSSFEQKTLQSVAGYKASCVSTSYGLYVILAVVQSVSAIDTSYSVTGTFAQNEKSYTASTRVYTEIVLLLHPLHIKFYR